MVSMTNVNDDYEVFISGLLSKLQVALLRSLRGFFIFIAIYVLLSNSTYLSNPRLGVAIFFSILISINLTKGIAVFGIAVLALGILIPPEILSLIFQWLSNTLR